MKKLLTLGLLVMLYTTSYGTHLMGGELTVAHLGGADYEIRLTAYRDTLGIPFSMTATFDVYNATGTMVLSKTTSQQPLSGTVMAGYPYGVEVYFFVDTITVPGPGEYSVRWYNCCRNGAIQNLSNPLAENMFLSTTFTNVAGTINSSPVFLAPPVTYLPINQPWQYNSLPFDVNGDSLSWSIDTPLTNFNLNTAGWVTPSAGSASGAFLIDQVTGQIDWTPDQLGNFVASILVEEFNNGVKIGEIRRDYQMIVVDDTTKCPRISNFDVFPTDQNGHAYMNISAEVATNIILLATDPEGDPVQMQSFGEPLILDHNPAIFTSAQGVGSTTGTFSWIPDATQVREKPYRVVFRTRDQMFTFDETVLFYVNKIETPAPSPSMGILYPVPANNLIFVPLTLSSASHASLELFTVQGAKLAEYDFGMLDKGNHVKEVNLSISAGTYFVTLKLNGKEEFTRKIVIAHHGK